MNLEKCYFKIKPSDTLFFRDSYPFKKEMNNHLESMNMPYPSVIYGAIFSALLRQGKFIDVLAYIKQTASNLEKKLKACFRINSIYLYDEIENQLYVKAPLDLFQNDDYKIEFGLYKDQLFYSIQGYDRVDEKFISLNDLLMYYSKSNTSFIRLYSSDYFFKRYKKVGIEINKKVKTIKDKNLYRLDMVEFSDKRFSYIVECGIRSKDKDISNDVIKFGGESKLAGLTFTEKTVSSLEFLDEFYQTEKISGDKVKIVLTSPINLEDIDGYQGFEKFKEDNEIEYAVTGKPDYIGGYNMAAGRQKKIKKAIPAGSVLVLKDSNFKGKTIKSILQKNEKIKLIRNNENSHRGFGNIIVMDFKEELG